MMAPLVPVVVLAATVETPPSPRPIPVRIQVEAGPYFVNQVIRLQVAAIAEGTPPGLDAPRLAGARLVAAGSAMRPLSVSAIGDLVTESNQFLFQFRLIPERPGRLVVPGFVVRLGERRGVAGSVTLDIRPPPPNRPAAFLGGVGPMTVAAAAMPPTVRVGETIEYQVRLEGPGAVGATGDPLELTRIQSLPIALEVLPLPGEAADDPPSRTFRYRLRPTRAGATTLPPVPVAWLDPKTSRYQTVVGPAVPIRAVEVPDWDASGLELPAPPAPPRWPAGALAARAGLAAAVLILLGAGVWDSRRRWRRFQRRPRVLARRLARRLERIEDESADSIARNARDALTTYLQAALGRAPGALTPVEVEWALLAITGNDDLARRAGQLVERLDRLSYAEQNQADPAASVLKEARELYRALAEIRVAC